MLCANRETGLIEFHFDEFIETKNAYMQYLKFILELNDNEKEYVKVFIAHHSPPKIVSQQIDLNLIIKRWSNIVFSGAYHQTIKRLTDEEVGRAIKEGREVICKSRKEVADILHIDVETLKSYELGRRKLPYTTYYLLSQIFEIARDIFNFLDKYRDYFMSFDKIIVYYDRGQQVVEKALLQSFGIIGFNVEFKDDVKAEKYRQSNQAGMQVRGQAHQDGRRIAIA